MRTFLIGLSLTCCKSLSQNQVCPHLNEKCKKNKVCPPPKKIKIKQGQTS